MFRYFKVIGALVCFLLILSGCGNTPTNTITGFSSVGASAGTQITIYGTGFDSSPSNNMVAFTGAQPVAATSSLATMIVVTVPTGATTGVIMTSTDGGPEVTSPTSFTVLPQPTFNPISGSIGTTITITGTNFDSTPTNNVVTFNGILATVISSSPTQIVTTVPTGSTNGPIMINVDGGTYILTSANSFSISQ
jgi:IPT/TIG domain